MFWRPVAGNHRLKLSWLDFAGATRLRWPAREPAQTLARLPASVGTNADALSRGALVSSVRSKVDALAEHIACETTFPDFSNASANDSNCAAASRSIETGT